MPKTAETLRGVKRTTGMEAIEVRNVLGRRCLCLTFALGAGVLPFAVGSAWDRLITANESESASHHEKPHNPLVTASSESARTSENPSSGSTTEAYELKTAGTDSRWSLPLADSKNGWLVAVGMSSVEDARHKIRLHARTTNEAPAHRDRLIATSPVGRKPTADSTRRHVVARHTNPSPSKSRAEAPESRSFAIQTSSGDPSDPAFYETISSRLKRMGNHVTVYVDERDCETVSAATLDAIIEVMDDLVPSRVAPRIGNAADVDGDGRITILVSQVLGRMADGSAVLDGFVRASDFDSKGKFPRSHACDMIYVNSRIQPGPFLKSLLAHEFTHAVIASGKIVSSNGGTAETEDSWLDEGLAHLSERWVDDNWENLDYRIAEFHAETQLHRLVVNDHLGLAHGRAHGHRGATFLFLDWCRRQFGDELAAQLVKSSKSGIANLEEATATSFETLFRGWTIELMSQSATRGSAETIQAQALKEDWLVGVPRATELEIDSYGLPAIAEWTAEGTTVRLFRLIPSNANAESIELAVDAPAEAKVQITAMPLTRNHRGLGLEVYSTGGSSAAGKSAVRLRLTNRDHSRPLKIQAAAWESLMPGLDARDLRQRRGFVDTLALAASLGTITILPGQSVITTPIEVEFASNSLAPMRWKAVAHDDTGSAVFSWADMISTPRLDGTSAPRIAADIMPERSGGTFRR
jgi:hypothetical protein